MCHWLLYEFVYVAALLQIKFVLFIFFCNCYPLSAYGQMFNLQCISRQLVLLRIRTYVSMYAVANIFQISKRGCIVLFIDLYLHQFVSVLIIVSSAVPYTKISLSLYTVMFFFVVICIIMYGFSFWFQRHVECPLCVQCLSDQEQRIQAYLVSASRLWPRYGNVRVAAQSCK